MEADARRRRTVGNAALVVDDPDCHLRAAEVDSNGLSHQRVFIERDGARRVFGAARGADYKVYRARRGIFSRLRTPDLPTLKRKTSGEGKAPPSGAKPPKPRPEGWTWRRVAKWVAIAAGGWIVLSIVAFMVSAGIQSTKLANPVGDVLN